MTTLDIEAIRAATPGCRHGVHLLACGSALMPDPVIAAVGDHLRLEAEIGGYEAADRAAGAIDAVHATIAAHLNAAPQEIALKESATAAWTAAFYALPLARGTRILTSRAEYAANYVAFLHRARELDLSIEVIPDDASGALDPAALEAMMDDRVSLIAITWVPTNGGLANPAEAVGAIARRHGVPYLLDACQMAGQRAIDVQRLGCDIATATGRKFLRGPRGTGFLYVREGLLERLHPAMLDHEAAPWVARDRYELRPDARRFEFWEKAPALWLGLGAAVAYADSLGMAAIEARLGVLSARLREGIGAIPGAEVCDLGTDQTAIISFTLTGQDPQAVVARLREEGIAIGSSDPASTLLDSEARSLPRLLRAAPHVYTTEAEIDRLLDRLSTPS